MSIIIIIIFICQNLGPVGKSRESTSLPAAAGYFKNTNK